MNAVGILRAHTRATNGDVVLITLCQGWIVGELISLATPLLGAVLGHATVEAAVVHTPVVRACCLHGGPFRVAGLVLSSVDPVRLFFLFCFAFP